MFLVPVFSKWIMVPVITHGAAARDDGLGRIFIIHGGLNVFALSCLVLAAIFACGSFWLPGVPLRHTVILFFILAVPSYAFSLLWTAFCAKMFGGLTGDTMGAVSEVGEILLYALALLWI
jgi:adenosylcobinamide-GDP ribazoletransferase